MRGTHLAMVGFEVGEMRPWIKECGWPPEARSGLQLTAKKSRLQYYNHKEISYGNNLNRQGNKFFLRASRSECSLADPLILVQ